MNKILWKKKSGIWRCLMYRFIQLALVLLVATGTGLAANNVLDPNDSYFFVATSNNPAGLESIYFNLVDNADSNPPALSIISPIDGISFNDIINITVSAPETVAISKVQFFANDEQVGEMATAPFAFPWDTSVLSRGDYAISIKAFDAAGNQESSDILTVTVAGDTLAPTVAIGAPANSSTVGKEVSVTANALDNVAVTKVEFYLNGALQTTVGSAPYGFIWNTAALANGPYTLRAMAYDAAGNVGQSADVAVNVFNDTTAPTVSIVAPALSSTVGSTVAVSASASDNVAVTRVEFYLNGALQANSNAVPYGFSWNTRAIANGFYTLSAKAYDAAGNVGQSALVAVHVFNDTTAPTVSIVSPVNGSTMGGLVAISASASDNVAVSKVEIYINGVLKSTSTGAPYRYLWNTASIANGAYTLSAKAYDAAGNVGQSAIVAVNVFNDTTAPTVSIVSPVGNSTLGGSLSVSASASDNVAVSKVEFYLNGALQATSNSAPYAFTWNTVAAANGLYILSAKAYDAAGNVGQSAVVTVNVVNDTTAPTIAFTSPNSNYVYGNNVTISSSATDNIAVARMELYIDGTLSYTAGNSSFSVGWNFPIGPHTLTVKAYDSSNNVSAVSRSVYRFF